MKQAVNKKSGIIIENVRNILDADNLNSRDEKLQRVCEFLASNISVFDWVGFYLVHSEAERELILGPFVGEPTEHTRISFGQGICGQSAATNETFVVQDVNEADNYLSCSIDVKAEIVVPVKKDGEFVAELDIDSHTKESITDEHRQMLEEVCEEISAIF